MVLREALEKEGYEVLEAENGEVALRIIKQEGVDLLILDGKMPVMDGTETLRRLRTFDKELPVIMLTAYPGRKTHLYVMRGKLEAFITKPVNLNELILKVESIFRGRTNI
jgi:DNA-binding response OmpR family regulator